MRRPCFAELGWTWAYRTVDARSFGLPQRRRRVFILASPCHDPRQILFADDAGPPAQREHGRAYGFNWTEGRRGLGWAVDAIPPLRAGFGVGIPYPFASRDLVSRIGRDLHARRLDEAGALQQGVRADALAPCR